MMKILKQVEKYVYTDGKCIESEVKTLGKSDNPDVEVSPIFIVENSHPDYIAKVEDSFNVRLSKDYAYMIKTS